MLSKILPEIITAFFCVLSFDETEVLGAVYLPPPNDPGTSGRYKCPDLGYIENGERTIYMGGRATKYFCDRGFTMIGQAMLRCSVTGKWNYPKPLCAKSGCVHPGKVENAWEEMKHSGAVIHYHCYDGYKLRGPETIYCSGTNWNENPPTCKGSRNWSVAPLTHCPTLQPVRKAQKFEQQATRSVTYYCQDNYILAGADTLYCRWDGKWTSPVPKCGKSGCSIPEIRNGRVNVRQNGASILIACDTGYERHGSELIACDGDDWDEPISLCLPEQGNQVFSSREDEQAVQFPTTPVQGLDVKPVTVPSLNNAPQQEGHMKNISNLPTPPDSWTEVLKSNGSRVSKTTTKCSDPPEIINATVSKDSSPLINSLNRTDYVHHTVHYFCNEGFESLNNSSTLVCIEGEWIGELPNCQPQQQLRTVNDTTNADDAVNDHHRRQTCLPLQVPANGKLLPRSVCTQPARISAGTDCRFECQRGYSIRGKRTTSCTDNGQWSHSEIPYCELVKCQTLQAPEDSLMTSDCAEKSPVFGQVCNFTCTNEAYLLDGFPSAHCQYNGSWSHDLPRCLKDTEAPRIVSCPHSFTISVSGKYAYGVQWATPKFRDNGKLTQVWNSHNPGATLERGAHQIKYISVDTAGNFVECSFVVTIKKKGCDQLEGPVNGQPKCIDLLYGRICEPKCDQGYHFYDENIVSKMYYCSSSGNWSPEPKVPDCMRSFTLTEENANSRCPSGTEKRRQPDTNQVYCVTCPRGMYSDGASQTLKCKPCLRDFYQDEVGQASCKECPQGTHTYHEMATSSTSCLPE